MKRMLASSLRMLDKQFGKRHPHSCLVLSALSTANVALRLPWSARLACASSLRASGQPGGGNGQLRGLALLRGAAVAAGRGSEKGAAGFLRRGDSHDNDHNNDDENDNNNTNNHDINNSSM